MFIPRVDTDDIIKGMFIPTFGTDDITQGMFIPRVDTGDITQGMFIPTFDTDMSSVFDTVGINRGIITAMFDMMM